MHCCLHFTFITGNGEQATVRLVDRELFTKTELREIDTFNDYDASIYDEDISKNLANLLKVIAGNSADADADIPKNIGDYVNDIDSGTHNPPPGWIVCGYYMLFAH